RSIRNIPIPEGRRKSDKAVFSDGVRRNSRTKAMEEEEISSMPPRKPEYRHRRYSSRKNVWVASGVAAIILIFAVLSLFNGATLAYVPKSASVTFDNDIFTASKTGEDNLLYSVVKLSGDKNMVVPASGEEEVSRKASGVIVVYNNAASEPQKLIENTRFESPSGKIYRIAKAITIPGKKGALPGSIEVTVYADEAGDTYNMGLTDFTVPGLKGTPRYSTIYARSKTPIAGGFVGQEKVITSENLDKAKTELKTALGQELISKAQAEVPEDFLLSSSLSSITFEDLPQSASDDKGSATINMRGNLYGIMFKRSDLAKTLAERKLSALSDTPIDLVSFDTLELTFAGTPPSDLLPINEINFKVSGTGTVVWRTDELALKSDLVGRSKRDIPSILKNYQTLARASTTLRAFWKSSLP
ncbi:MAG: hypothetical protein AAB758_03125, partial [Patescibacteria group bacterium]